MVLFHNLPAVKTASKISMHKEYEQVEYYREDDEPVVCHSDTVKGGENWDFQGTFTNLDDDYDEEIDANQANDAQYSKFENDDTKYEDDVLIKSMDSVNLDQPLNQIQIKAPASLPKINLKNI